MNSLNTLIRYIVVAVTITLVTVDACQAKTLLKSICRVKGQEENTLQGLGLVVGLNGTGDGGDFLPTIRSLATAMQLMGNPIGKGGPLELKNAKNIALVTVTATVPAAGARQGDRIDCIVSSFGAAKSLEGGRLFMTPLQGPQVNNPRVFAMAEGPIQLDGPALSRSGRIHRGCRLEEDFYNPFVKDNKITLVLDKHHADFQVAQDIAELINSQISIQNGYQTVARAVNQVNIEVLIPQQYRDEPVSFVSQVLSMQILEPQNQATVVINERTGSVVISGEVEIGAVVVTHKNLVIEAGANPASDRFVSLDTGGTKATSLKSLVEALNAVKLPTADIIEIIKGLEKNGKLHGKLVVQ
jgi:flagellar P-ring protein precursor FlgI